MLFYYEFFEYIWGFIVQYVQFKFESSVFKYIEDVGIGIFDRMFNVVWYRFGKDGISVKIKDNKKVIIGADRWYEKLTCLISAYFASDGLTVNVIVISMQTWCLFVWRKKWQQRGGTCVCYCIVTGYDIIWFFVIIYAMNGTGCLNCCVQIFVKRGIFG